MADETFDAAPIAKLIGVAVGSGASAAFATGASSWWALRAYREGRFSRGWWRLRVGALGGVTTLKRCRNRASTNDHRNTRHGDKRPGRRTACILACLIPLGSPQHIRIT